MDIFTDSLVEAKVEAGESFVALRLRHNGEDYGLNAVIKKDATPDELAAYARSFATSFLRCIKKARDVTNQGERKCA